jgi:hypothetical protein
VAEEVLYVAKGGPSVEGCRCNAVAERVRRQPLGIGDTGGGSDAADQTEHGRLVDAGAGAGDEHRPGEILNWHSSGLRPLGKVSVKVSAEGRRDRQLPRLAALAAHHDRAVSSVVAEVRHVEPEHFTDPHPQLGHQPEQRSVTDRGRATAQPRGPHEGTDLLAGESGRSRAVVVDVGPVHRVNRVAASDAVGGEVAVPRSQRAQSARLAGLGEAPEPRAGVGVDVAALRVARVESGLFTTSVGTAIDPRNVNRWWSAVCERAGVRPLRPHDLRHAAASLAFAEGATIREVQAQLRHTRQGTTADIYVEVFEEVRRGTADRMDSVLRRIRKSA